MKKITALLMTFLFIFTCASCRKNAEENLNLATQEAICETAEAETQSKESKYSVFYTGTAIVLQGSSRPAAVKPSASITNGIAASAVITTLKATAAQVKRTLVRTPYTEPTDPAPSASTSVSETSRSVNKTTEVESQAVQAPIFITPQKSVCTISINCATVLANSDKLKKEKAPFVPKDGFILKETSVEFAAGETAFDILKRACAAGHCSDNCKYCQADGIQLEFEYTLGYGSYYIEGIHQIYEKDCGAKSGWMYKVNGVFPNEGCSAYTVKNGDRIEFVYTCDLGNDVGA